MLAPAIASAVATSLLPVHAGRRRACMAPAAYALALAVDSARLSSRAAHRRDAAFLPLVLGAPECAA
jgi:hypothetical protein